MYTAYFDRSGQKGHHRCTVVAGWVTPVSKWNEFERGWHAVLERFGVPYLHMRELAHRIGPFSKWKDNEPERLEFLKAAVDVIRGTLEYWTAVAIPHDVFAAVNKRYDLTPVFKNEFVFAARECATYVGYYLTSRGPYGSDDVDYVFDRGEEGVGAVVDLFAGDDLTIPSFKASRDTPETGEKGLVQLQAADFLAYECLKLYEGAPNWRYPFVDIRKSFTALHVGVRQSMMHEYTELMIETRCEQRGLLKRHPGSE
jgi:hypothetical protein